jgi:hypothetical protein
MESGRLAMSAQIRDEILTKMNAYESGTKIRRLAEEGLQTDGGHHKQWFLEQILELLTRQEAPDHEPGIAP